MNHPWDHGASSVDLIRVRKGFVSNDPVSKADPLPQSPGSSLPHLASLCLLLDSLGQVGEEGMHVPSAAGRQGRGGREELFL